MTFNVAFEGSFSTPPYTGQPDCPVPINFTAQYGRKSIQRLELTGTGTKVVDLSALPTAGAKLLVVQVDADATAQPIQLLINGGTDQWEVSAGGFVSMGSPKPVIGITELSIAYASNVNVWVWAYG